MLLKCNKSKEEELKMVLTKQKCVICGLILTANGHLAVTKDMLQHFHSEHKKEVKEYIKQKDKIESEQWELRKKLTNLRRQYILYYNEMV
jgi:hypothetical protein